MVLILILMALAAAVVGGLISIKTAGVLAFVLLILLLVLIILTRMLGVAMLGLVSAALASAKPLRYRHWMRK